MTNKKELPIVSQSDTTPTECTTCSHRQNLVQLGINMTNWDFLIALAGNPNVGKSTVFNALTGLRQHTGNWPGKTVARAEGGFQFDGQRYKIVDLPGTYSLLSASVDEEVARDFILFGRPDATIVVADATQLERNLNLVLQVAEITERVVVCMNLMDEARRKSIEIDDRALSRRLGVPVIPTAARSGEGLGTLMQTVSDVVHGRIKTTPHRIAGGEELNRAVSDLVPMIEDLYPGLPNARWVAMRLLDGDYQVRHALEDGSLAELAGDFAS